MRTICKAEEAWKLLNGIFCIYKPAGLSIYKVREILVGNIVRDLNSMNVRPPRDYVKIEGSVASGKGLIVSTIPNYADHMLVTGPRYQPQDVRLTWITFLGRSVSGVVVMAVNRGNRLVFKYRDCKHLRRFELKGKFGLATDSFMEDGRIIENATYDHINQWKIDQVLAAMQASHQAEMFKYSGVSLQSQTAYELASLGLIRPAGKSAPLIYSIRCIHFKPPDFTIELNCINENELYLKQVVHDLGLTLKSCAVCTQIRQTQYGHFTLDHALLRKHWTLEHVLNNILYSRELVMPEKITPASSKLQLINGSSQDTQTSAVSPLRSL
ncbi:pseudouridylate synthase TRUB2, mitochondrial [Tachypleus tridentatus]|uniref:pseudouridylate synthase TRUB2, mitochondrial n=1 Tax=Tachypleus tridentatus TaxID=6853 RepID=UPI003FCFA0E7